ncbi:MAG: T9SS type A sorting domain-containing protein, partial [Saprospiraceae bacterium]
GTMSNSGTIYIGSALSVGSYGLLNRAVFNNTADGEVRISRSIGIGLYNLSGTFNNDGKISIGALASVGTYGLYNQAVFNNHAGEISIDRCSDKALYNPYGTFNNAAKIIIGALANAGDYGLVNEAMFKNDTGGDISINQVNIMGLLQLTGTFTNFAKVSIGEAAPVGQYGLVNHSFFNNNAGSELRIDRATEKGLFNFSGVFNNTAQITIGAIASPGKNALQNESTFNNNAGAQISMDRATAYSLYHLKGVFTNEATITIGAVANSGTHGLVNEATFNNMPGGTIDLNRINIAGLTNLAGNFSNLAKITIGAIQNSSIYGLYNNAIFTNDPGGDIQIDRTVDVALYNNLGYFSNSAKVTIGAVASTSSYGLRNNKLFDNNSAGELRIDRIDGISLYNQAGTFTNAGSVTIGAVAGSEQVGVWNNNIFNNNSGGEISIDRSTIFGLENATGTFTNLATINIATGGGEGIGNQGTLLNGACATLVTTANVHNGSQFTNYGLFRVNTASAHINTSLTNNGIIEYPQGNPIPNVTNNDLLVAPATGNCTTFSPALQIGGANSFTAGQTWYLDAGLSNPGGTYNQATNTLTVSSPAATFYFNVHDNVSGCDLVLSLNATYVDAIPPTVVCKDYTVNLNAGGTASIVPANVFQSGSDNCGTVNLQSVSPNTFDCASLGANLVQLTVNDGNGNTATCTAFVTVKDVTPPVAKCKDAAINLDASGNALLKASFVNNNSTDNCSYTMLLTPAAFSCANVGVNPVTLQITDAGGNVATCTAKVTVKDLTAPIALCKNPVIYLDDNGQATLPAAQVNNGSSDACGIATMSISQTQFNCSELQGSPWNITLNLVDTHGNTAACLASVTVKDKIVPTAICQDATVKLGANGQVVVNPANLAADSYDNCSVWSYSPVAKTYTSANLGLNNLTITVKDWSGNAATCVSVVTVQPYSALKSGGEDRAQKPEVLPADLAFNVFPNPSAGAATVAFRLPAEQAFVLRIFDLSGRVIWSRESVGSEGENSVSLHLTGVPAGMYVVDFQSEGLKKQSRLSLEK